MEQEIHFEPLTEAHIHLMLDWFNTPHVQEFYSLRNWTYEEVSKKLEPCIKKILVNPYIIYIEDHPIGYIQSYAVKDSPWENQDIADDIVQSAAGFDIFIGDKTYLRKGIGSKIVESFLEKHIWPSYRYCFVDPDVKNEASTRLFKKCGFVQHKQIDSTNALKQKVRLNLLFRHRDS